MSTTPSDSGSENPWVKMMEQMKRSIVTAAQTPLRSQPIITDYDINSMYWQTFTPTTSKSNFLQSMGRGLRGVAGHRGPEGLPGRSVIMKFTALPGGTWTRLEHGLDSPYMRRFLKEYLREKLGRPKGRWYVKPSHIGFASNGDATLIRLTLEGEQLEEHMSEDSKDRAMYMHRKLLKYPNWKAW